MNKQSLIHQGLFKLLAIGLMLVMGSSVNAGNQIGEAEAQFDTLQFYPEVDYQQLTLTVAGEDNRWEKSFGPNEIASFSNQDANFPSGQYQYELVASPNIDPNAHSLVRNDRALLMQMERIERKNTYQQSGRFIIENGEIILLNEMDILQSANISNQMKQEGDK